jgi:hypothetical protein
MGKRTIVTDHGLDLLRIISVGSVDQLRIKAVLDELRPDEGLTPVYPSTACFGIGWISKTSEKREEEGKNPHPSRRGRRPPSPSMSCHRCGP